tara:strand:- start:228 stop:1877 length:1650 start_codon:yes stop_codon:yes gene_type:complete
MKLAVYMDTSGSMSGSRGDLRDEHWDSVHPTFEQLEMRYVSFSSRGNVNVGVDWEKKTIRELSMLKPYVFNGATHLWGLILNEANKMIGENINPEEVLIYLVTDGMDNQSQGSLFGFSGISTCIDRLNELGFHAEFWIVGVGLTTYESNAYSLFADRSGGRYLELNDGTQINEISNVVDGMMRDKKRDPAGWKHGRLQIIRDFSRAHPESSTLSIDGERALPTLRSVIPPDHLKMVEIGTKADAAMESREFMGMRRNMRRHRWIFLTFDTFDSMTESQIIALAREFYNDKLHGKIHLILDGFPPLSRGVAAGSGTRVLSDLRQWRIHPDLKDLIEEIILGFGNPDTDKVKIGTLDRMKNDNRIPIPNQPYVILDPDLRHGHQDSQWWNGKSNESEWNVVPGIPTGPCHPGLIVTPFINCHSKAKTYHELEHNPFDGCEDFNFEEFDSCTANVGGWALPNSEKRLPDPFKEKTHLQVWEPNRDCFIEILREALCHMTHCTPERVVIDLTDLGKEIGLDSHPALKCFEDSARRIAPKVRLSYRYSRVSGLI